MEELKEGIDLAAPHFDVDAFEHAPNPQLRLSIVRRTPSMPDQLMVLDLKMSGIEVGDDENTYIVPFDGILGVISGDNFSETPTVANVKVCMTVMHITGSYSNGSSLEPQKMKFAISVRMHSKEYGYHDPNATADVDIHDAVTQVAN